MKIVFLSIILIATACSTKKKLSIVDLYKNKEYKKIIEQRDSVKIELDSILYNISILKERASLPLLTYQPYLPDIDYYYFMDAANHFTPSGKVVPMLLDSFNYSKYSSNELYYLGMYFDLKFGYKRNLMDRFMRESVFRDTTNVLAIYELAKNALWTLDNPKAYFLAKYASKLDPDWKYPVKMINYLEDEFEKDSKSETYKNVKDVLKNPVFGHPLNPVIEEF